MADQPGMARGYTTKPIPWRVAFDALPSHGHFENSSNSNWKDIVPAPTAKASAVAVLFNIARSDSAPATIILTRRSLLVGSHKGQISFPGGRREGHDESPGATAVREASEELGIPQKHFVVHGILEHQAALSRDLVVPVLVTVDREPDPAKVQSREVAELILVPWDVLQRGAEEQVSFNLFGLNRKTYLYRNDPNLIWGLTAQILAQAQFHC